ncbi:MAG: LON peptidase substrate-binding domain-containing protein, partial [Sulfuricellaceae bacterium]
MSDQEPIEGEILDGQDTEGGTSGLVVPSKVLPPTLYILPLSERPFFPAQSVPLLMNEGPWMETVKKIGDTPHKMVGLALVKQASAEDAKPGDFYEVGTVARMHHPMRSDGKLQFIAEGVTRFRIVHWISDKPPYVAQVEYPSEGEAKDDEVRAYAMAIINSIKELIPLNPLYSEE